MKKKKTISCRTKNIWTFILLFLCLSLFTGQVQASGNDTIIRGSFTNTLKIPPASNPNAALSSSAACFGGHVKVSPNADGTMLEPGAGEYRLSRSSFNQIVSDRIPFPGFQEKAIDDAYNLLYYENAGDSAAFRYKDLLYELDLDNKLSPQFQNMETLWTEADRDIALEAAGIILNALRYDPHHTGLRSNLLDIYYNMAVADFHKAMEKIAEAQKAALGFPGYVPMPGEFQISEEIVLLEQALPLFEAAIRPYFEILNDPLGIDMTRLDAAVVAANIPFGYYLFQQTVPLRSLHSPLYKDTNGQLVPVVSQDILFTGFKDLVLLFRIKRAAARAAAKLAKLYALRGGPGDADLARVIIRDALKAYTDGSILNYIFPEEVLVNMDEIAGLAEARAGWAQGLTELNSVKEFLDGNTNPLGLDKNFLALVQTDVPGTSGNVHKDSYNYFAGLLIPDGANPSGYLKTARDKYDLAYSQYETVQRNLDTITTELQSQRQQYGDRLRSITGVEFPDPPDPESPYHSPGENEGSDIYLQIKSIELAQLRIQKNEQEIENLEEQIRIEIERRAKEHNINNLIAQTHIIYGDKKAKLTKKIGSINAKQAEASAASNGVSKAVKSGKSGHRAAKSAKRTAKLEAEKEKLSAEQSARIQYLTDQIQAAESEARIKNMLLNMHILAISSLEAVVMLEQETGKLQSLLDEKAYLETRWKEAEAGLATRYFADPSHRMLMNQYLLDADFAFQKAQFWVYIMARALDYKFNTRFIAYAGDKIYTSASVFAMRNAKELADMAAAIWDYDALTNIGDRQGTQFVKFSVREDFLGFRRMDADGYPAFYPDPVTGEMVSSVEAFRSYLKNIAFRGAPSSTVMRDFSEVVRLEFNTAQTNFEGTFFSSARWNEKIKWIAVKINADSTLTQLMTYLEQSGTGFIRNSFLGTPDPENPDQLIGEMTGYPIRYWFPETNTENWLSKDTFGFGINAVVTQDNNAPAESWQKREFHEMPAAVSKWVLEIPLRNSNGYTLLNLDTLSDIEIWFYNYYHARN